MIDVSICICTFRRPAGLLRLLRSLARLEAATPPHEIIVVDNDAGRSGEPAIRRAAAEGLRVRYFVEPLRGIARARNRAVAPAGGEFVAFVDDDEEVEPGWLLNLCDEVRRHGADGGVGPVVPRFHERTPRWLIEGGFFERPRPATGTALSSRGLRTGNALIRRRALLALHGPFDERYALSGGEDTDLFVRLIADGGRFIAVDSAVVHEHLSPNRTRMRYLLRRRFLVGMGSARFHRSREPELARRGWQRTRWLSSGLALGVSGLVLLPASRTYGMQRLARAARDLGCFAFYAGFSYQPYARDTWR